MLFALILLRTYSAADCGKIVVLLYRAIRPFHIAFFDVRDKVGYANAYGATAHTRRVFAIKTSLRLVGGKLCGISERNLVEIVLSFLC